MHQRAQIQLTRRKAAAVADGGGGGGGRGAVAYGRAHVGRPPPTPSIAHLSGKDNII